MKSYNLVFAFIGLASALPFENKEQAGHKNRVARNAVVDPYLIWPDKTAYYGFASGISNDTRKLIREAFDEIEKYSCVKITRGWSAEKHFIFISNVGDTCSADLGYQHLSPQGMNLGCPEAKVKGGIIHETLHALGFDHHINSPNRDEYVEIKWNNILSRYKNNFVKHNESVLTNYRLPYDYDSIMNYPPLSFSSNGQPTVVAKKKGGENIGQFTSLSGLDIYKINLLYGCTDNYYYKYYSQFYKK